MHNWQKLTDRSIIIRYIEGDTSVFPELVRRYHKKFCEKAYWVTRDKEISKDVAQECWIVIMDKLHTLENLDSFQSWSYRIVYTTAIDKLKKGKKDQKNLKTINEPRSKPEEVEGKREQVLLALSDGIRQLPSSKQDIIRLFYLEEYSIREISKILNIPIGTVKSRLFKAREKLKSLLENRNYE